MTVSEILRAMFTPAPVEIVVPRSQQVAHVVAELRRENWPCASDAERRATACRLMFARFLFEQGRIER